MTFGSNTLTENFFGRVFTFGVSALAAFIVQGCGGNTMDTGSAGSGGSSGAGRASGSSERMSGGSMGLGGSGGVSPGTATIAFTVTGPGSYCTMSRWCGGDGSRISINDAAGNSLKLTTGDSDVSCESCTCPCPKYACQPAGVTVTGFTLEWGGLYNETSTCANGTSCVEPIYAKPGKYTATFCATPGTLASLDGGIRQCITTGPAKCGSVEFDFPSSAAVKGTVGP